MVGPPSCILMQGGVFIKKGEAWIKECGLYLLYWEFVF